MTSLKKLIFIFAISLSFTSLIQAQEQETVTLADQLKGKTRSFVARFLGEEVASSLFGESLDTLQLPTPPTLEKDARSVSVRNELNTNDLTEEQWKKYNYNYVNELFEVVRQSRPNSNDIAQWMNVLEQGGKQEGVYRALVLDQTYAGLENFPRDMNEEVIAFTMWFMKTFNNKEYKKEQLVGVNFFSIKRIVTERTLETIDALGQRSPDDLYDWYGVFSGEMARRYPEIFVNEIRKNQQMNYHAAWAQTMPEQIIKAEALIKLHMIFNFLQG